MATTFAAAAAAGHRPEIVLAGGKTPLALYREFFRILGGQSPRFWIGDERVLPLGHPDRNGEAIDSALGAFGPEDLKRGTVPELCQWSADSAKAYADRLRLAHRCPPRFDLVFLGIGEDGHTAGLFPNDSASLDALRSDNAEFTADTVAPVPPRMRMTMTARTLASTNRIVFLTRGFRKLAALGALPLSRGLDERRAADGPPWVRVAHLAEAQGAEVLILHDDEE